MSASKMRYSIGVDVSTQTISAALIGVMEEGSTPRELVISSAWRASRPCAGEVERKTPAVWVRLVRELVAELKRASPEAAQAGSRGISTTFPGVFAILRGGSCDPRFASLYDNTDDAGACSGEFHELLASAEAATLNRMWPGNMAIGLVRLVKSRGLRIEDAAALVPANTAFAYELLGSAGRPVEPGSLPSDLTEAIIGGLYDASTGEPVPGPVADLLEQAVPKMDSERVRRLLPRAVPSWRNVVPDGAVTGVRDLLGLPEVEAVSIGAGDSPLGVLALCPGPETVLNVRGSSDSPMITIDLPHAVGPPIHRRLAGGAKEGRRETVLHYPVPTVTAAADSPWCAVAPMLRSGKVWDWVRRLRFPDDDPHADAELEEQAKAALKRRLTTGTAPLVFDTALGGERAPDWDSCATGSLTGLVEAHGIGDIALAALEGMSVRLRACIEVMELRYGVEPPNLLLAGGPVRNVLWNWVTGVFVGKNTFATEFSDASLLGAAMVGYAASYDGREPDDAISRRLRTLSEVSARHPLVSPKPVTAPDDELASFQEAYARLAATPRCPWPGA
jgi:sugar (pentulose or hexulose) kinase